MDFKEQRSGVKYRRFLLIGLFIVLCGGVISFIFAQYRLNWAWTGFNKTLWDWMQLLIVPATLTFGVLWLNQTDQKKAQEIADDNQKEALLQTYLDRMATLLLEKQQEMAQVDGAARVVARTRTFTTLLQLDATRKRHVLTFLIDSGLLLLINLDYVDFSRIAYMYPVKAILNNVSMRYANMEHIRFSNVEAKKINAEHAIFSWAYLSNIEAPSANLRQSTWHHARLSDSDLSDTCWEGADLRDAVLTNVKLNNAYFRKADLRRAVLRKADLSNADLRDARLDNADLRRAKLSGTKLTYAQLQQGVRIQKKALSSCQIL